MDACRIRNLTEARTLLTEGESAEWGVPRIARAACLSPFHFIREFESLFGTTPHQVRMAARLDRAKRMLARGEHNVSEVCFELGMSSLGSFSDWFARQTGVSPREYQKKARILVSHPGILPVELFPGCLSLMGKLPPNAFRNFREAN